jgi:hypothetical protein
MLVGEKAEKLAVLSQETGMPLIKVHRILVACVTVFAFLGVAAGASSQTIGAPRVTVSPNGSVILTYAAPSTPPSGTFLAVTYNGAPLGNIPIGTATTVGSGGPIPAGLYTVQVVWGPGASSDVVGFRVSPGSGGTTPATTVLHSPVVTGNTVFLSWDPIANATSYELEAFIFANGQRLIIPVEQTSITVPNVPAGNYAVRVRGRNSIGFGGFSNTVLAAVQTAFRMRDMEATLTWNTEADVDLHVIEPNGVHVWWKSRTGTTVVLDRDDTTGFGPETASINIGGSSPGVYQVFIVHYASDFPTTSTVAITLGVGTANPLTKVFTRFSEEADAETGINVALVDVRSGMIGEDFGIRPTAPADEGVPARKP